jgi:hypothetical protein
MWVDGRVGGQVVTREQGSERRRDLAVSGVAGYGTVARQSNCCNKKIKKIKDKKYI